MINYIKQIAKDIVIHNTALYSIDNNEWKKVNCKYFSNGDILFLRVNPRKKYNKDEFKLKTIQMLKRKSTSIDLVLTISKTKLINSNQLLVVTQYGIFKATLVGITFPNYILVANASTINISLESSKLYIAFNFSILIIRNPEHNTTSRITHPVFDDIQLITDKEEIVEYLI